MSFALDIQARVRAFARQTPSLRGPVVIAVSGGPDSTALAAVLCESGLIAPACAAVAHFDHRLRGDAASARERDAVAALCARYELRPIEGVWDAPAPGEARARDARYRFLATAAREIGAAVVATGHTADDQAETVLMRALRGAGLAGLAGMEPDARFPHDASLRVVRPLLCLSRAETRACCDALALDYVDDPTNADTSLLRNRVRHELLPLIETASPGARVALLRLAEEARAAARALEAVAARALLPDAGDGSVRLSRRALRDLPADAVPYAYRLAFTALDGAARDLGRRHYAQLARAHRARTGSTLELPHGLRVIVDHDAVAISMGAPSPPPLAPDFALPVPFAGDAGAWLIEVAPAAVGAAGVPLPPGAVVRARRPGDRIRPRGLGGRKKLQDFYVDRKVPRRERDGAPVIAAGADVLWTPFGAAVEAPVGTRYTVRCRRR